MADDELSLDERETLDLVVALRRTGRLDPLIDGLRAGQTGPERVRDALEVLAELDRDLLIQITLDTLIEAHLVEPGDAARGALASGVAVRTSSGDV